MEVWKNIENLRNKIRLGFWSLAWPGPCRMLPATRNIYSTRLQLLPAIPSFIFGEQKCRLRKLEYDDISQSFGQMSPARGYIQNPRDAFYVVVFLIFPQTQETTNFAHKISVDSLNSRLSALKACLKAYYGEPWSLHPTRNVCFGKTKNFVQKIWRLAPIAANLPGTCTLGFSQHITPKVV